MSSKRPAGNIVSMAGGPTGRESKRPQTAEQVAQSNALFELAKHQNVSGAGSEVLRSENFQNNMFWGLKGPPGKKRRGESSDANLNKSDEPVYSSDDDDDIYQEVEQAKNPLEEESDSSSVSESDSKKQKRKDKKRQKKKEKEAKKKQKKEAKKEAKKGKNEKKEKKRKRSNSSSSESS